MELKKRKRQKAHPGITVRSQTGCGHIYITINWDEAGPIEVFATLGKAGSCAVAHLEALTRAITLGLKYGIPLEDFTHHFQGIRCPSPTFESGEGIPSCVHAIGMALKTHGAIKPKNLETFFKEKTNEPSTN